MADDKVFIGFTDVKETKYGEIIKFSLGPKDWDNVKKHTNEKGYLNMNIQKNKAGKYFAEIDLWKPQQQTQKAGSSASVDDLPFNHDAFSI